MSRFGHELKELREAAGLTQHALAVRIGASGTYVSALESGRKPAPPRALVSALSAALHIDEEALWAPARDEREERLTRRVDGVPASLRLAVGEPRLAGRGDAERGREAAGGRGDGAIDQEMQGLMDDIRRRFPDAESRRKLLRAVRAMIDSIRP